MDHNGMKSAATMKVLAIGAVGLLPALAAAQSSDPRPQRASLAYFGERVVQPGARIGYEAAVLYRQPHELLLGGNFGGFAVPGGYSLMVMFEGGYRLTLPFGGFFDLRPGLGYTAAWVGTADLTLVSNYLTLSALGGIGYDFFPRLRVPISLMARSGVLWRAGTGPLEGVSYALDIGIAYQFGTSRRPKPITLPFALPPPAEAPANLDDPPAPPITPVTPSEPVTPRPPGPISAPPLPPPPMVPAP